MRISSERRRGPRRPSPLGREPSSAKEGEAPVVRLAHWVHGRLLWLLIGAYAIAALWPAVGLSLREIATGEVELLGETTRISLPMALLAFLLWNAGMAVQWQQLRGLARGWLILVVGLAANILVPLVFTFLASQTLRLWDDPEEVQQMLVGLALIAGMPIAGSSTAWSRQTNSDMALSLGLVILSTLLSPLTTPVVFRAVAALASGDYATDLSGLAVSGTRAFLMVGVVIPSLLGVLTRWLVGEALARAAKPYLLLTNTATLLLLIYLNTSLSLPQAIAYPDYDFLALAVGVTTCLCAAAFAAGWWVGWLWHVDRARQTALIFGLGMNNNGTGLVLSSMALADHPQVMLPIIIYTLVQHLAAGLVAFYRGRGGSASH